VTVDDSVSVTVDNGVVEVPDVSGAAADDATSTLEAEGLTVVYDEEPDDPALCDVTDQSPPADDEQRVREVDEAADGRLRVAATASLELLALALGGPVGGAERPVEDLKGFR
jgi:PASTA domain